MSSAALDDPVVIVSGVRTAIGRFGGTLKDIDASDLGAECVRESISRVGLQPEEVDEVVMGQVGQVGREAYNARLCALGAGLPYKVTTLNVNRQCASGLQAIVSGVQEILLREANVVVAGGNESMSRLPFIDYHARDGWRLGSHELIDGTIAILTCAFGNGLMGVTAERVAERYDVGREEQDRFAHRSQERAVAAVEAGTFDQDIVPVTPPGADEPFLRDEYPRAGVTLEKLAQLKPAFKEGGTVTPGNSSGINDGAAAVVLMRESEAKRRGLEPRLRFRAAAVAGLEPEVMGYGPALAIPKVLEKTGLSLDDIDLVELNEAFAAQAVAVIRDVGLDEERVNVDGGAIALGHPVGATGAILTIKLANALERLGKRRGMVTMCMGGGQGMAAIFERPNGG